MNKNNSLGAISGSRGPSPSGLGPPGFDPGRIAELAKRIPALYEWATGSGTERSFAQIISPLRRNFSWYALAETEEKALETAVALMETERTGA